RLIKSPVNTCALSECNSAGVMLLAGGTGKRKVFRTAVLVVHGLTVHGRPPADLVEKIEEVYTEFWRKRTRLPESWLPLPRGVSHVLTAEKAVEYGVADEVIEKTNTAMDKPLRQKSPSN